MKSLFFASVISLGLSFLATGWASTSAVSAVALATPVQSVVAVTSRLPRAGHIRYSITSGEKGLVVGKATSEWHHDGAAYAIRNISETAGLLALLRSARVVQSSEGSLSPAGLVPHEFRIERNGAVEIASFDWKGGKITLSNGGNCALPSMAGIQDVLSMFFQLGLLANPGAVTEAWVVTGRKCERYSFVRLGEERLALKFGEQRTLHLRSAGTSGSEATEIWVGLDLAGLPLKIRHVDRKGDVFDQVAEEVEIKNDKGKN